MTDTPLGTVDGLIGVADHAVRAARAHRAANPDGFDHRHDTPQAWHRWARRARVARTLATALNLPVDRVLVTDDPHRTYPARTGPVPGDLITVTDPGTATLWRFIPDDTTPGEAWLLLGRCPRCATEFPVARIATLADLGDHLDLDTPPVWPVPDTTDHHPDSGCTGRAPTDSRPAGHATAARAATSGPVG